jgi:hypothetical protein
MADYWVIDEISGFKVPRSECRINWKGQMVHWRNYEPRHPQDIVKVPIDDPHVNDPRPRQTDRYPTITADDL